jgi:DnaJ like chaperone protein
MSVFAFIQQAVGIGGDAFVAVIEWAGATLIGDPVRRRQVGFSVALIALSAKMAKADGVVTVDEVGAFERIFTVPPGEERNVSRLFDLAQRDVAGFESYAGRIATFYGDDRRGLEDVLDGLFAIAGADGAVHEAETVYLERVSEIFGIDRTAFERVQARHVIPEEGDPYLVLGVDRSMTIAQIRVVWRALARENHPDSLLARGVPPEAATIAHRRMATINRAFDRIQKGT